MIRDEYWGGSAFSNSSYKAQHLGALLLRIQWHDPAAADFSLGELQLLIASVSAGSYNGMLSLPQAWEHLRLILIYLCNKQ